MRIVLSAREWKEVGGRKGGREEGKRRRGGVLFANFHDLSLGAGGERRGSSSSLGGGKG